MNRLLVLLSIFFCAPFLSHAQICARCEIPSSVRAARLAAANKANEKAELKKTEIINEHFPFGAPKASPSATNEEMLVQFEWITWYDEDLKMPLWVAYEFNKTNAKKKIVERLDCFHRDPRLSDAIASFCTDYKGSGYDRGHLLPANDAKRNHTMMDNSFLLSNMAPQLGPFNQKIWMRLEHRVNRWAENTGINVITGAIFDHDGDGKRDPDDSVPRIPPKKRVAKATHFYKIITHQRPNGSIDTISFVLPHNRKTYPGNKEAPYLDSKIRSIDEIEALTGVDFFPDMPNGKQNDLEAGKAASLSKWFTLK